MMSVENAETRLDEFIDLVFIYKDSPKQVELLLKIVLNVVELSVETGEESPSSKQSLPEESLKLSITGERVKQLCEVLNYRKTTEETIRVLGSLVSVLCLNEKNLSTFIGELTNTVFLLSNQLNSQLDPDILMLKDHISKPNDATLDLIEFSIIKRQSKTSFNEIRFLKVFQLILQLYEKSLERSQRVLEIAESSKEKSSGKDSKEKKQEEIKNRVCKEVREQFGVLMQNESLIHLWLNICESLSCLETIFIHKEKLLTSVIHGMKPLIESFFIKYKILCDDEMYDKIASMLNKGKSKESVKKQQPANPATMDEESVGPKEKEVNVNSTFEQLRQDTKNLKINELFAIMCEKNRVALNKLVSQNITLLFDSMSAIPKVVTAHRRSSRKFWTSTTRRTTSSNTSSGKASRTTRSTSASGETKYSRIRSTKSSRSSRSSSKAG